MTVNTLSARPTATFIREPLPLALSPGETLARWPPSRCRSRSRGLGRAAARSSVPTSHGGRRDDDPFAVLDRLPPLGGGTPPLGRSAAAGSDGSATGWGPASSASPPAPASCADARLPSRLLRPRAAPRRRRAVVVRGARHPGAPRRAGGSPAPPQALLGRAPPARRLASRRCDSRRGRRPPPQGGRRCRAGSPPARSFRPTSACGSTASSTARRRAAGAALARVQPAYGARFATPTGAIASLSPELFLRRAGEDVVTAPIKGTAPRDPDRPPPPPRCTASSARARTRPST